MKTEITVTGEAMYHHTAGTNISGMTFKKALSALRLVNLGNIGGCLLYTSDAADE